MEVRDLPCRLAFFPAPNVADLDGEIERAVFALVQAGDLVGAARRALTIANPYRRAVWLRQFRKTTLAAALGRPTLAQEQDGQ